MALNILSLHSELSEFIYKNYGMTGRDIARLCCVSKYFRNLFTSGFSLCFHLECLSKNKIYVTSNELSRLCRYMYSLSKSVDFINPVQHYHQLCLEHDFTDISRVVESTQPRAIQHIGTLMREEYEEEYSARNVYFWIRFLHRAKMFRELNGYLDALEKEPFGRVGSVYFWKMYGLVHALCHIGGKFLCRYVPFLVKTYFQYFSSLSEQWEYLPIDFIEVYDAFMDQPKVLKFAYAELTKPLINIIVAAIIEHPDTYVAEVGYKFLSEAPRVDFLVAAPLFFAVNTERKRNESDIWRYAALVVCKSQEEVTPQVFSELLRMFMPESEISGETTYDNVVALVRMMLRYQKLDTYRIKLLAHDLFHFYYTQDDLKNYRFELYKRAFRGFKKTSMVYVILQQTYKIVRKSMYRSELERAFPSFDF